MYSVYYVHVYYMHCTCTLLTSAMLMEGWVWLSGKCNLNYMYMYNALKCIEGDAWVVVKTVVVGQKLEW